MITARWGLNEFSWEKIKIIFQVIKTRDVEQEKVMNNAEARQRYYEYVKKLLEKAKQEEQDQNKEEIKFE